MPSTEICCVEGQKREGVEEEEPGTATQQGECSCSQKKPKTPSCCWMGSSKWLRLSFAAEKQGSSAQPGAWGETLGGARGGLGPSQLVHEGEQAETLGAV